MTSRWSNPVTNNLLRDKEGNILASGSLAFYEAGTSTPLAVYSNPDGATGSLGSVLNADAYGLIEDFHFAPGTQYKVVAYDAADGPAGAGAVKWTRDYVFSLDSGLDTRVDSLESSVAALSGLSQNGCLNGGMRVANRNDVDLSSSFQEGKVDKLWGKVANVTGGTLTQGASTDYASNYYAHFSSVTTSGAGDLVAQIRIPSKDAGRFVDQAGTASLLVYQDTGGDVDYTIAIKKPASTADDFSSLSTVGTSSATTVSTATDTRLEYSIADLGDVSNGIAIEITATLTGSVSSKNFRFTEAQMEIGGTRTSFGEFNYEMAEAAIARDGAISLLDDLPYDLNTLTTPGEYFITLYQSVSGSASFTNGPTPPVSVSNSAVGGALIYVSKSGNNVRQAFTWISASDSTLPGTTNTRVSGDGGSSWTNWYTEAQKWGELTGKTDRAGADGYETLPNGFIIQWGLDTSGTVGLTFPLTFPNAILSVSTTAFVPGTTYVHVDSDFSVTTSGLTIFASAGTPDYYWIAVGY